MPSSDTPASERTNILDGPEDVTVHWTESERVQEARNVEAMKRKLMDDQRGSIQMGRDLDALIAAVEARTIQGVREFVPNLTIWQKIALTALEEGTDNG